MGNYFLHLLEIVGVVGGNIDGSASFKAPMYLKQVVVAEESSFVVSFFWPGIREIEVQAVD